MPTYIKNSAKLKNHFDNLKLPANAKLFTADAVSMYTNINTDAALTKIAQYLRSNCSKYRDTPIEALITGLEIVMRNNVFTLGDTTWKQNDGAAMGQPPSPSYATVFFGIHEIRIRNRFLLALLPHQHRYIDDYIGIWIPMANNRCERMWLEFKKEMNKYH